MSHGLQKKIILLSLKWLVSKTALFDKIQANAVSFQHVIKLCWSTTQNVSSSKKLKNWKITTTSRLQNSNIPKFSLFETVTQLITVNFNIHKYTWDELGGDCWRCWSYTLNWQQTPLLLNTPQRKPPTANSDVECSICTVFYLNHVEILYIEHTEPSLLLGWGV